VNIRWARNKIELEKPRNEMQFKSYDHILELELIMISYPLFLLDFNGSKLKSL